MSESERLGKRSFSIDSNVKAVMSDAVAATEAAAEAVEGEVGTSAAARPDQVENEAAAALPAEEIKDKVANIPAKAKEKNDTSKERNFNAEEEEDSSAASARAAIVAPTPKRAAQGVADSAPTPSMSIGVVGETAEKTGNATKNPKKGDEEEKKKDRVLASFAEGASFG